MPRQNQQHCKIRKRVSSSSSSSSSVVKKKNYKLKKGVLVGKLIMASGSESPLQNFDTNNNYNNYYYNNVSSNNNKGKEGVSARKLAATLWEINGFHSPARLKEEILEEKRVRSSNNPHTPVCDQIDGSKVGGHRRRSSATSQKLEITGGGGPETLGKATSIEVSSHMAGLGENNMNVKTRLKDVNNSLIASKELVKVLFRILSQEEQHSSRITLVSALRVELDRARLQVDKLIQDQRFYCNQMDALLKHFAEEKAAWKSREQERIREAVSSLARELEIERKLRRQAERLNKKLGMELADTKAHFSTALKELDSEKRAREILEQTCDELARGIGEERVEVEELKRESAKAREEVEKERQMLQLADVLREERVQMKLSEARYEYEEKNAALERLKNDIETHLKSKENGTNNLDEKTGLKHFLKTMQMGALENGGEGEGDSGDSELHSIELNMDNNNRSYKWSFACEGNNQGDSRRGSMDEVFKGRRSLSEKIQWESICLQRKTSDGGIEWDFTANNKLGSINGFDIGRPSQVCEVGATNEDVDDDGDGDESFKRYNSVDKSHRLPSFHGSPISTGNSSRLREACSAILQDLASKREQLQLEGQCRVNNI
ncbi:centrosomal protein of 83 kDa-like isoform X2 [Chenopodium quinoa]|uniref:centrosomal protein of 83 kDa-like isoform X2 n=1 Tax=Chenopodium quinoa TaxID=63459 RepID=UPI000B76FB7F|nr:centrosomal protein of 83 kDa-like isoform X2 [Chenopodium quinoa]